MMKIGAYEQVQKLYEDSVPKKNVNPFAASKDGQIRPEEAASYQPGRAEDAGKASALGSDENKLSDAAKALLEKLREKYGNMDIMVSDFSSESEAQEILSRGTKEYSVLFTTEELEKMAADEDYLAEVEDKITSAVDMMKSLQTKIDESLEEDSDVSIKQIGISFGDDGSVTLFATLEKMSAAQKERIEKAKEANEEEAKAKEETKQVDKNDPMEKFREQFEFPRETTVSGTSEAELLEAITGIEWKAVPPMGIPVAGAKIDMSV